MRITIVLLHLLIVAPLLMGSSCQVDPKDPGPTDPTTDGGIDADAPLSACARACTRLRALACEGWEGSPDGASCETVCENTESNGVARFCPEEVAAITTCDELDAAFAACEHG